MFSHLSRLYKQFLDVYHHKLLKSCLSRHKIQKLVVHVLHHTASPSIPIHPKFYRWLPHHLPHLSYIFFVKSLLYNHYNALIIYASSHEECEYEDKIICISFEISFFLKILFCINLAGRSSFSLEVLGISTIFQFK